jgi:hypothetical protein
MFETNVVSSLELPCKLTLSPSTHLFPSIDLMILCILIEFKKQLVSLGADGLPSEEMKTGARKWLEDNNNNNKSNMNIVHSTEFDAYFHVTSNRLLIWA